MLRHSLAALAALGLGASASAQSLMVVESTNDNVMLFDAFDGSLTSTNFIDLTVAGASTPIEALQVGSEIWVTDQVADKLMRFSLDGTTYLGDVTGTFDNIRGFEVANGQVFVSNSGTGNGAPGDAVVVLDTAGNITGSFVAGDPFDVLDYNGQLMVANIAGEDLDLHQYDGTFVLKFHDSDGVTGIDFPEQVSLGVGGNVLAAGFSTPSGIYEYDSTGAQVNYYDTGAIGGNTGLRGVWPLGNGNILYTNGSGVHILDPVGMTSTTIVAGVSGRFISQISAEPGAAYCFGDGTGAACPCGNTGGLGEGCANSTGSGAILNASGSTSVAQDNVVLSGQQLAASQPGLYFQGDNAINGGLGNAFGDGLRCAGGAVVRLEVVTASLAGTSSTSVPIAATGGVLAGQTKRYQLWYRDPIGTPCGSGFNFTNGYEIVWAP